MADPIFLHRPYSDAGILSGGSWQMPLTNAQDPDVGVVARSTNAANSSTKFTADLGAAFSIGGIMLGPINASPASTYRIRAYSDAALTVLVNDGGVKTVPGSTIDWSSTGAWLEWEDPGFWLGVPESASSDDAALYLFDAFTSDLVAQYWLVELFDSANADGYVQFGRLMIARALRLGVPYSEDGNQIEFDPVTDVQETLGARRDYWKRGSTRRRWRCSFPDLAEDDLFGDLFDTVERSGIDQQVFVVPDPSDLNRARKRCFLATFDKPATLTQRVQQRGATAFDLIEVT